MSSLVTTNIVLGITALVLSNCITYKCVKDETKTPVVINNIYNPTEVAIPEGVKISKGLRNKNPLNVKYSKDRPWKGQVGDDGTGFAIFSSWEYGVRAASFVLKNYAKKHSITTIRGIVTRFSDTDQEEYIKFLCNKMKLSDTQEFNVIQRLPELLRYMSKFELGLALPDELFIPYDVIQHI